MPEIHDAEAILEDIYQKQHKTQFMEWVYKNADL